MTRKKTTIRDVASVANVSIATISRVLNNSSAPSEEIRQRVQKVIAELNYVPQRPGRKKRSPAAQEGKHRPRLPSTTKGERTLALVLNPNILVDYADGEIYHARLLKGIYEAVAYFEYQLMVFTYDGNDLAPAFLNQNRFQGLLVDDHLPLELQRALVRELPVVFINSSPRRTASSSVRPNFGSAVTEILHHLWDQGHREIAHFKAINSPLINPGMINAYERFFSEKGYEPKVRALNVPRDINPDTHLDVLRAYTDEVLAAPVRPTAILSEDVYVARILMELSMRGVRLPDEMSLVGIDDTTIACHLNPKLSSYRFPMEEIGKASVEELLHRIGDPERSNRQVFLDGTLIERETVAPISAPETNTKETND